MSKHLAPRFRLALASAAGAAPFSFTNVAHAVARTPTITGNAWVGMVVIGVVVATIYMLIMGVLHVERRDSRMGGRRGRDNGWYGVFPYGSGDDEDSPDFHHHHGGDGGDGGGGEGGF